MTDDEVEVTERVTQVWPKDLKDRVREKAGPRGITEFTLKGVEQLLETYDWQRGLERELNLTKHAVQQLADCLVMSSEKEDRLQALLEVEFPSWVDTTGWPQAFAERVRPELAEPEREELKEEVKKRDHVDGCSLDTDHSGACIIEEVEGESPPVNKDDLYARIMKRTGGEMDPGFRDMKVASELPQPDPVVMQDLCPKCGEERVEGECWTCP